MLNKIANFFYLVKEWINSQLGGIGQSGLLKNSACKAYDTVLFLAHIDQEFMLVYAENEASHS